MKQQVETVLRIRNYASMHYKGSMSNLLTTKLYKHITTQYNTEETYTDSKIKALTNPSILSKAAQWISGVWHQQNYQKCAVCMHSMLRNMVKTQKQKH